MVQRGLNEPQVPGARQQSGSKRVPERVGALADDPSPGQPPRKPLPPLPPIPGLMEGGCDWVGVFTPFSFIALVTTQPSFTLPINVPNAEGAKLNLQVWWYKPGGTPTFQVSNGLHVAIGKGGPQ